MRTVFVMASVVALAACGAKAPLTPPEGASLPVAPYGTPEGDTNKPNADQLLELEALAAPERSVELRRRSEDREDDPFDLPPQD
ncbi:MAG: lipoprotein [Pseudomonadota bacterium]